jgi:hypothetical protein
MGAAIGAGFSALATDLAVAAAGIAFFAVVALGIALYFSILDSHVMTMFKSAVLRIIGGSLLIGGASAVAAFVTSNFKA